MKKITILILVSTALFSCNSDEMGDGLSNVNPIRVTQIQESNNQCSYYTVDGMGYGWSFYDTCGKFQVGDILKLVK